MKEQYEINSHLNLRARPELLEIIANISDLKSIKESFLFSMMEDVLTRIAVSKYGTKYNVRVRIYKSNGAIVIERVTTVVEEVTNLNREISLVDAQKINPEYKVGDEIIEELPPMEFTRNMMQKSLRMLNVAIKEFEKKHEYEVYKDSVGELVSGVVKRSEFGNIVIDLGNNYEGYIPKDQTIRSEKINVGDRIRAVIINVKENIKGPQIILSRSNPNFIVKLFFQEIPEVFDGIVTIKAIAREPGSRTKIIVESSNPSIDPVGVCIGFKGAKIQGVLHELKGEKIDVIKFSDQFLNLVINAFWPVEILKVIVDEEKEALNIVVNNSQLSMVIGRGGQNIRLVSKLLRWNIEIMTEEQEKDKRQKATQEKINAFINALDVDDVVAHLLILEGFNNIEDLANAELSTLLKIEDFTEELANELILRAQNHIKKQQEELNKNLKELDVKQNLIEFNNLSAKQKVILGENKLTSLQEVADLSSFELAEILAKENLPMKKIENIIMSARQQVIGIDIENDRE